MNEQMIKQAAVISFTESGSLLCRKVTDQMEQAGIKAAGYTMERYAASAGLKTLHKRLAEWVKEHWEDDCLIFIGAAGIAVRGIAPYVKDKMSDPAVIVIDEGANYAISLLSGHIGQANAYTYMIAGWTGAQPVITTATDIRGKFAVDLFASRNRMKISSRTLAKEISAHILDGGKITFQSDFPTAGRQPEELTEAGQKYKIHVTIYEGRQPDVLYLIPKAVCLGIGCRKGTQAEDIEKQAAELLEQTGICQDSIACAASIDLKKEETGLVEFAASHNLPFYTYSAGQLEQAEGKFTESDFVKQTTGVGNVCERAAVLASGGGRLLAGKRAKNGITAALAVKDWRVYFE